MLPRKLKSTHAGMPISRIFFLLAMWTLYLGVHGDNFDTLEEELRPTTMESCDGMKRNFVLENFESIANPQNSLSLPNFQPNRTLLIYAHNIVANRASFYSFVYRKLGTYSNFYKEPGLFYHYFSLASNVAAYKHNVTGSSLVFDKNCSYPNWRKYLPFNKTLPVFTPTAWWEQIDGDSGDIKVKDLESLPFIHDDPHAMSRFWQWGLPDGNRGDPRGKISYSVSVKKAAGKGQFQSEQYEETFFIGPSKIVKFTRPFFDCGRTNKWITTYSMPVIERMTRYLPLEHMRYSRITAVATADLVVKDIDFNPCPASLGNPVHSLVDVAKCKNTTMCQPLPGYGLKRGGYVCVCRVGYRYPENQNGPFLGSHIEAATTEEYNNKFDCIPIEAPENSNGSSEDDDQEEPVHVIIDDKSDEYLENITKLVHNPESTKCGPTSKNFRLDKNITYGKERVFETRGRAALRLANFLSSYLQNTYVTGSSNIPQYLKIDYILNADLMFGEVMANVWADDNVVGSGIFFRRDRFIDKTDSSGTTTKEFFGPYAWKDEDKTDLIKIVDFAGFDELYTENDWFKNMEAKWGIFDSLQKYEVDPTVRSVLNGEQQLSSHSYFATDYEQGEWLQPEYICNEDVSLNMWTVRYIAPFFGLNNEGALEFKGVVAVDVPLKNLDINQCPAGLLEFNPFKNTAKCDVNTTTCTALDGMMFTRGAYKCECKQGYHMPYNSTDLYFDGQEIEEEYKKLKSGVSNRFNSFKCVKLPDDSEKKPVGGTTTLQISFLTITFFTITIQRIFSR